MAIKEDKRVGILVTNRLFKEGRSWEALIVLYKLGHLMAKLYNAGALFDYENCREEKINFEVRGSCAFLYAKYALSSYDFSKSEDSSKIFFSSCGIKMKLVDNEYTDVYLPRSHSEMIVLYGLCQRDYEISNLRKLMYGY